MSAPESLHARTAQPDPVLESLYAKREKIYPREVHGLFAGMRVLAVIVLLGLFYGLAWVRWDGAPVLLFDLPARQFYIFGLTFFPQDFFYLALLLILAALTLFFFTALAGRLWCGYACPQTVWTELFMWMERKIEGDRAKQMRLDKQPWGPRKVAIKGMKHTVWIVFSVYTGFTFVGYFTPITELGEKLWSMSLGPWESFWILFYGLATYGNAGWMREQVCLYMCPYARFQSAMFDKDTLVISYETQRGEPRGARRPGIDYRAKGLGDCIDCGLCVRVCPTGIDIRDGLQYQCIACAACVDACDDVMDKMNYPKGLIRYTTENTMSGRRTRLIRPRMIVYGVLLVAVLSGVVYGLTQRVPLGLEIVRDRNALYRETNAGLVENVYALKILNMDKHEHTYRLTVSGIEGLELVPAPHPLQIMAGQILSVPVQVRIDPHDLPQSTNRIEFTVESVGEPGLRLVREARFLGPRQ
jgi:cytochrome c oxidase accessory protein FixG